MNDTSLCLNLKNYKRPQNHYNDILIILQII